CYFFFQAEDDIRDATVTGVQTCALPIYLDRLVVALVVAVAELLEHVCRDAQMKRADLAERLVTLRRDPREVLFASRVLGPVVARSEERRVGTDSSAARRGCGYHLSCSNW